MTSLLLLGAFLAPFLIGLCVLAWTRDRTAKWEAEAKEEAFNEYWRGELNRRAAAKLASQREAEALDFAYNHTPHFPPPPPALPGDEVPRTGP